MNSSIYEKAFTSVNEVIYIDKLHIPSGKVVACDPFLCGIAVPFGRKVSPGNYEVRLCKVDSPKWGTRIAIAEILFQPGKKIVLFEKAIKEFTDYNHYFVESGLGSFMDELTCKEFAQVMARYYCLNPKGNYYDDILADEFKKNSSDPNNPHDIGSWNLHSLPNSEMNVTMFASGLGDGHFESFWGLNKDDEVVSIVTDFGIL